MAGGRHAGSTSTSAPLANSSCTMLAGNWHGARAEPRGGAQALGVADQQGVGRLQLDGAAALAHLPWPLASAAGQTKRDYLVRREVFDALRRTVRLQVRRAGDEHQQLRVDAARHQRRIAQLAHANRQVDAIAHQVGKAVLQPHLEAQCRVFALQPGQQRQHEAVAIEDAQIHAQRA